MDTRALSGSQTLSADLVIAKKSVTILAGQMTLAMGGNRIVVQPGANQFLFSGYSAGWGPNQSFTAGGTTLQYTGNSAAFKVGASTGATNFIRLENFQIDASIGGSAARAMEIDNTIGVTLSNLKLLVSTSTGTTQEALRLDGTGGMNAYMLLQNLYLGGGRNTLHLTGVSGQGNSAFQIIGGHRTNQQHYRRNWCAAGIRQQRRLHWFRRGIGAGWAIRSAPARCKTFSAKRGLKATPLTSRSPPVLRTTRFRA